MAKNKGKNGSTKRKPVKQIQQEAAAKKADTADAKWAAIRAANADALADAAKKADAADVTTDLNRGLEDPQYPYQRGTPQDFGRYFGDETSPLSVPASAEGDGWGMLAFVGFVVAALLISVMAIV